MSSETECNLESESDEEPPIVMKRRRTHCFLDDDSDEEEHEQQSNENISDDDVLSSHSFESTRTEVVHVVNNFTTAADLEHVDNLSKDGGSTPARVEDKYEDNNDSDDELLSISSLDSIHNDVRPSLETLNKSTPPSPGKFADSDETFFSPCHSPLTQVPVRFTGLDYDETLNGDNILPGPSFIAANERGRCYYSSSSTDIPYSTSEIVDIDSGASSETNYEPPESDVSLEYKGDNVNKEFMRKTNAIASSSVNLGPQKANKSHRRKTFSGYRTQVSSDYEDEESTPIIPIPKRYRYQQPQGRDDVSASDVDTSESEYDSSRTFNRPSVSKAQPNWLGDVQRTVKMMSEALEGMPLPDDEDNEDVKLPPRLAELYPHQKYAFRWLRWREGWFPGGGILADEMGLGKTIEIISLIMKSKWDASKNNVENIVSYEEASKVYCIPSRTTLVVCPLSVLPQWCREMETKGHALRVHIYHGNKKLASAVELAKFDVVVTTYQTVANEIPKPVDPPGQSNCLSPLKRVFWVRIVLDEAHTIRNPKTKAAQALYQLEAKYRWAVTGTPIHNKPEDFFSMCCFLRLEPFNDRHVWDLWIGLKTVKRGAEQRLHILGKALILRRTKDEVGLFSEGKMKAIPPKTVQVVKIELKQEERQIYDMLMEYAQSILKAFLSQKEQREHGLHIGGLLYAADRVQMRREDCPGDIKFSHIFALLTRLRQCAVLPHLIQTMLKEEELELDEQFDELKPEHIISQINPTFNKLYLSSKFEKIIEDVDELRLKAEKTGQPMEKVIIVSCWTTTLDIVYEHLRSRNYQCVFITGRDDVDIRMDNMDRLNKNKWRPQVLLLSLMAGGVGLNLVGANHVFFVEPHWNPQHELQAQDRVHRFGQTKNVFIRRYIAENTIEDRIMGLQQQKLELAQGVLTNTKKTRGAGITLEQMKHLFDI